MKTDLTFGIVCAAATVFSFCFLLHLHAHHLFCLSVPILLFLPPPPMSLSDYVRECIVGTGQSYRGRRAVTVSGILCQAWASPIPHEHK